LSNEYNQKPEVIPPEFRASLPDKTQIEMYAMGSLAMFLKRFFVSIYCL
jgi:hypothetical protein